MFDIDLVEVTITRSLVTFIFGCSCEVHFYLDGTYANQFRCELHEGIQG